MPFFAIRAFNRGIIQYNLALIRCFQAANNTHQSGFAATGRAQKYQQLTFVNIQ